MRLCPVCDREVPILLDGRLATHDINPYQRALCAGSKKTPAEADRSQQESGR